MKPNYFLVLSVVLNIGLIGAAAYVYSAKTPLREVSLPDSPSPSIELSTKEVVRTNVLTMNAEVDEAFTWRAVEAEDFKLYIANLRSIRCPEETVRDIIVADVNKLFAAKMRQLWSGSSRMEYWKAQNWNSKEEQDRQRQMRKLQQEKSDLLVELLGVDPEKERRKEDGHVDYWERQYAFLSPEKQKQARDVQEKFEEMRQEVYRNNLGSMDEEDQKKIEQIYDQQLAAMSQFLTPTELEQYELRTSQVASQLRYDLSGFDVSEDEFRAIYQLRKERRDDLRHPWDPDDKIAQDRRKKAVEETDKQIEAMIGADRFKDYKLSQDHAFKELFRLTQRFDLPRDKAVAVFDMKKQAEDAVKQIRDDKSLDKQQRDAALKEIRTATEEAITAELGGDLLQRYRNRGGWWINNLGR
ncbi:MAG: hypothetical protein ACK4UN_11900 [Limisphaerales bacterium]